MRYDKNYKYIFSSFFVITVIYLLAEFILTGHKFGVPLDDTWIHFRYAENFAKGFLFQYNIGEATPGTSSPLWVIIISISFLVSSKLFLVFALLLGSLFLIFTCIEIYKLSLQLGFSKNYSLLISFLTLLCGRLLWSSLSGMEITLFCYLTIIIVRKHLWEIENEKVNILTGLILGLSVVTRPESYLFAGIYYFITILLLRKKLKPNLKNLILSFVLFLLIILPYPIFCYYTTGEFLPNTFKGQNAGLRFFPDFEYLRETGKIFFKDNVLILVLWITAMLYFLYSIYKNRIGKKYLLINFWIILLPLISSFLAPNWRHHGRYLIPLIPFINILSINIFVIILERLKSKNIKRYFNYKTAFLIVLIILSSISTFVFALALGWNTDNINSQQVKIADWINTNLPDEKCIGVNDIGAITFITKRKIVDLEGLVTPIIFNFRQMTDSAGNEMIMGLLKKEKVNYIIIYPEWYKTLMAKYQDYFEKIYSARLENNTICGSDEMVVYKIHWEKKPAYFFIK